MRSYSFSLVPDGPCPVEVLPDEDLCFCVAPPRSSRWYVYDESTESDAVVICDGGLVSEGDSLVSVSL